MTTRMPTHSLPNRYHRFPADTQAIAIRRATFGVVLAIGFGWLLTAFERQAGEQRLRQSPRMSNRAMTAKKQKPKAPELLCDRR